MRINNPKMGGLVMKKRVLAVLLIVLSLVMATNALASSIDFPSAVFVDQDFKLQQNSGSVDCDMPSGGGNYCLVAWTSPDGSDDGSFNENPANPDPAAADRWQKYTVVGTYTVTITECVAGNCSVNASDTDTVEVLDPATIDGEISAGYYFETQTDWLQVRGYAQANAQSARAVWQGDDGTRITQCAAVNQGNNPEFTHTWGSVSSTWTHQSYMLFINYFQGPGCVGLDSYPHYWVGDFDLLQIRAILNDLDALSAALNSTNATLQAQIDDLYSQVGNMSANLTAIEAQVDDLWDLVNLMNHGTINLEFINNEVTVYGEAPVGAAIADVEFYDSDGTLVHSFTVGVDVDSTYTLTEDTSAWDEIRYTVRVTFYDSSSVVISQAMKLHGLILAADQLVDTQNGDGGWPWTIPPGGSSPANIIGEVAVGLVGAYEKTGDAAYLAAIDDAYLFINNTNNSRSCSVYSFLVKASEATGDAKYATLAQNRWDARKAGYGDADAWAAAIVTGRTNQGYAATGLLGYDLDLCTYDALVLDSYFPGSGYDSDADSFAEAAYQWAYVNESFNVSDDTATWYILGINGLYDMFQRTGLHASEAASLRALLLSYQQANGGFPESSVYSDDYQGTAYVIRTLMEDGASDAVDAARDAADWLLSEQNSDGVWDYSGTEYPSINGMILYGVSLATEAETVSTVFEALFTNYINRTLHEEIAEVWDALGAHNHATILIDEYLTELWVYGEAPIGALSARIGFWDINDDSLDYNVSVNVSSWGINDNEYETLVQKADLDSVRYAVAAQFYNASLNASGLPPSGSYMQGYYVSLSWDGMYLAWLEDWLDTHEAWLINNTQWLNDLNTTVGNHSARLDQIEAEILAIQAELVLIQANITDLHATDLWLQTQIDDLVSRVDVLEAEVIALWEAIELLNHGDLDLVWDEGDDRLRAKIKFPLGATKARLMAYDADDELYDTYGIVFPEADNYKNVDWYGLLSWDPQVYTIKVKFMDDANDQVGRWVSHPFYGVYLFHVDLALYGDPEACADIDLPPEIYNELQDVLDEPDQDILWWAVEMIAGNNPGMTYGEMCDYAEHFLDEFFHDEYDGTVDEFIDELPLEYAEDIHTILRCLGYDDELHLNTLWNMCQQGDIDALERFTHGFNFVESKTFETFIQQNDFVRGITFGLNPKYDADYEVYLTMGWSNNPGGYDISQQLTSCEWMQRDQWNSRIRPVHYPPTWPGDTEGEGRYRVWLEAFPCTGDPTVPYYMSNRFNIRLDDLANPWPVFGLSTVAVTPDVDNFAEDVYWTNDPNVEMSAMLGEDVDWMEDLRCEIWNYVDDGQSQFYERWDFTGVDQTGCEGDIDLSAIPATHHSVPMYDIEVCAHPIVGQVECDLVTFGWDTTPPSINFIFPAAVDILSGVVTFAVDATDDGVMRYVNITLVNKTNANMTWPLGLANYSNVSGYWEIVVNTSQVPDGWYNISVVAVDYADNVAYGVLDPGIDNEPPVVESVMMSGYFGETFLIEALISDTPTTPHPDTGEPLGSVVAAEAEVWGYLCDNVVGEECHLDWCESYEDDPYWECGVFEHWDQDCLDSVALDCEQNWETYLYDSYDACYDDLRWACQSDYGSCETFCDGWGESLGFTTWEECINWCYDEHCEYIETGYWDECETFLTADSECVDQWESYCDSNWEADQFASYGDCVDFYEETECAYEDSVELCLEEYDTFCLENWWHEGYDSYEQCIDDACYEEYCSWFWNDDCSYTMECDVSSDQYDDECLDEAADYCGDDQWLIEEFESYLDCYYFYADDECFSEGEDVIDCIAREIADCEDGGWEGEYDSYEHCIEEETLDCYADYCSYNDDDGTNPELVCDGNCLADACPEEDRLYDPVETEIVALELTSGDSLLGTWSGELDSPAKGVHYHIDVYAVDAANNENTMENVEESAGEFFSDAGYTIEVNAPASVNRGANFNMDGSVTSTDGSTPAGNLNLAPWNVDLPLFGNLFAYTQSLGDSGEQVLTATFTPDAACEDRVFTGSTTVDVAGPNSGGGSGGGGSGDGVGGNTEEEPEEQPESEPDDSQGGNTEETQVGTGSGGNTQEEDTGAGTEAPEEPSEENLITGAATGGGFFSGLTWLWIALGLLALLLLLWLVLRKR